MVYKIKQPEIPQKTINNFPIYLGNDPGVNGAIAFYRVGSNKLKIDECLSLSKIHNMKFHLDSYTNIAYFNKLN